MAVSSQLHAPTTSFPEEQPFASIAWMPGQVWLSGCFAQENFLVLTRIKPQIHNQPAHSLVILPNKLTWFHSSECKT